MKMNIAHINLFRKIDSNSLLYIWGSWWCLPFSSINQEVHRIRLTPRDWGKTCSLVDLHPAIDTHFLCVARGKQIPHHNQNNINIKLHQYLSINQKRGCTISDELPGSGSKNAVCIRVSQKNQKSEFWNVTYPSGFHRLDEPPEKISAL